MAILNDKVLVPAARRAPWKLAMAILACLLTVQSTHMAFGAANSAGHREYEIKAAMLYNFARFVEWPARRSPAAGEPLVFGVLGRDPFGSLLDNLLEGQLVYGHPIRIRRITSASDIKLCHLLFVSDALGEQLRGILRTAEALGVLTVGESDGFCQRGGMIGLFRDGQNVRFEIATDVAQQSGFHISSKLLRLAKVSRIQSR